MLNTHRLWILLLVVLLAGCTTGPGGLSDLAPENTGPMERVETETKPEYFATASNLDDHEQPHGLDLLNGADDNAVVRLRIVNDDSGESFDQTYEMAANARVTGELETKANYTITVEHGDHTEELTIARSDFDCNHSGTTVEVSADGTLASQTVSTLMGCVEVEDSPTVIENETTVTYLSDESNLGENENPHGVNVVNDEETEAHINVRINRGDETVFEKSYVLVSGAKLHGVLDYKANYTVTVTEGDREATEELSWKTFDCNSSNTTFTISEEDIEPRTISTMAYCPPDPPEN